MFADNSIPLDHHIQRVPMFPFLARPTTERDARVTDGIMNPGRLHQPPLRHMPNGNGVKSTNAPPAPQNDIVPSTKTMYIHSTWIKGRVWKVTLMYLNQMKCRNGGIASTPL